MHLNKAPGLNMVVIETFSALDDTGINIIVETTNERYDISDIPEN